MSVLYKALQKAAKDNEQRQPAPASFDPERLAGSGVIRAGGRSKKWQYIGSAAIVGFALIMGGLYIFTQSQAPVAPVARAPVTPPPAPAAQAPAAQAPAPQGAVAEGQLQPPAAEAPAASAVPPAPAQVAAAPSSPPSPAPQVTPPAPAPAPQAAAPAAQPAAPVPPAAPAAPSTPAAAPPAPPAPAAPAPTTVAQAPAAPPAPPVAEPAPEPKTPAKATSAVPKAMTREPMPTIAADSPTRMLSPPISVKREQFALAGVGNAVQVRQVDEQARNDVKAGYTALIRGEYGMALGFYDAALKAEPTSVLAMLGRGAALQKLGQNNEARAAYEAVLKTDAQNREALINLTGLLAESQPADALRRLMDLDNEYPGFSPIKAQIGMTYAKMGNLDGALDYLQRAIALTPDAVMYHFNLAVVLDRMNLREQAAGSYRQVLALMAGRNVPELSKPDIERRLQFLSAAS
jgi:Tfp pilus assembly protein PilF